MPSIMALLEGILPPANKIRNQQVRGKKGQKGIAVSTCILV